MATMPSFSASMSPSVSALACTSETILSRSPGWIVRRQARSAIGFKMAFALEACGLFPMRATCRFGGQLS